MTELRGFGLIEIILTIAIAALLGAIAIPSYRSLVEDANNKRAMGELKAIELEIQRYYSREFSYPDTLADIGEAGRLDPWDRAYEYRNIAKSTGNGKLRKDHNLVPINSDYDLYSLGADGKSSSPLTAKISRDDIVRAGNGSYVGLAEDY